MVLIPPVRLIPTAEARAALGPNLRDAAYEAYRAIACAAKGLEIAHLQFRFGKATLAACSRVRADGVVEIELGLGDRRLPDGPFTLAQTRALEARAARNTRPRTRGW